MFHFKVAIKTLKAMGIIYFGWWFSKPLERKEGVGGGGDLPGTNLSRENFAGGNLVRVKVMFQRGNL